MEYIQKKKHIFCNKVFKQTKRLKTIETVAIYNAKKYHRVVYKIKRENQQKQSATVV